MKTVEQIVKECQHLDGEANIRAINKMFLAQDESHLFPINGRFNVTKRAINQARKLVKQGWEPVYGLEYALGLEGLISNIVNSQF